MLTTGKQVGFKFCRNCSGPTAGLRRLLGSELRTVGPAEAKERQPQELQRIHPIQMYIYLLTCIH